jgi:23S rRNA U2552 (ribose-2'-O)-methylase RlmE/FtsJ
MNTQQNIIINKKNQNNTTFFSLGNKIIKRMQKYNKLYEIISNTNLKKLNLFDIIVEKKISLYEPTNYDGWLLFMDYIFANKINYTTLPTSINSNKSNKILVCDDLCGFIELNKYLTESDDTYYVIDNILDNMETNKVKYLLSMYKIISFPKAKISEKDQVTKFDTIITKSFDKINTYYELLGDNGQILVLNNVTNIDKKFIEILNQNLKIFDTIELISPSIINLEGSFITCLKKNNKSSDNDLSESNNTHYIANTYGSIMSKANNFLNYHLFKVNKILKSIKHIIDIKNSDLRNKLTLTYENKLFLKAINIFTSVNIPVNASINTYYDNKMLTITNKLYSSLNVISYQFIVYEKMEIKMVSKMKKVTYQNLHNIAMNLNMVKRAIDTKYLKKWQYVTYQLDNYKSLGEYVTKKFNPLNDPKQKVSNAFLKIYEMMMTYEILPIDGLELKSFHFCEAPGMFIIGLNHYLQTKTKIKKWEWHGNSLTQTAEQTALSDSHGLIRKNKDKWLTGPEDSGDIRSLTNIEFFKEKLDSVDFITSDCGICVDMSNLNKYEELVAETDYAQFINMINLLKVGGSGIIKTFIPLELASNVCIIYMMTQIFEEVYLSKPITSRPQNSEVYLIGKKFLGIDKTLLDQLKQLLNKKVNPIFNPHLCWIENIPQSFINQLEDYIIDITRQQISYLLNIFYFVDNSQLIDQITLLSKGQLKEKTNEYWCKKFKFEVNKFNKLI